MITDARYKADTIFDLYRAIWRVTGRQQVLRIVLSIAVAALAAEPLKFQQLVVNSLVDGGDIHRVAWLCAGLLGVTLLSAALKFVLNFRLLILGERIVLLRLYANCVSHAANPCACLNGATSGPDIGGLSGSAAPNRRLRPRMIGLRPG